MIALPQKNLHHLVELLDLDRLFEQAKDLVASHRSAHRSFVLDVPGSVGEFPGELGSNYIYATKNLCRISDQIASALSLIKLAQIFGYIDFPKKDELIRYSEPFRLEEIYSLTRICHQYPFLWHFGLSLLDYSALSERIKTSEEDVSFSVFSHFVAITIEIQQNVNLNTFKIILDEVDPQLTSADLKDRIQDDSSPQTIDISKPSDLNSALLGVFEYLEGLAYIRDFVDDIDPTSKFYAAVWRIFAPEDDRRKRSFEHFFSDITFRKYDSLDVKSREVQVEAFDSRISDGATSDYKSTLDFFLAIDRYEAAAMQLGIPVLPSPVVPWSPLYYLTNQVVQLDPIFDLTSVHGLGDYRGLLSLSPEPTELISGRHLRRAKEFGPRSYAASAPRGTDFGPELSHPPKPLDPTLTYATTAAMGKPVDTLRLEPRWLISLKGVDIRRIGDLITRSERQILDIPNIGQVGLIRIEETLAENELQLDMHVPDWEQTRDED